MRLSRCAAVYIKTLFANRLEKTRGLCLCKSLLALDHSCSKRYALTSTCISSSRSILQIMLRAPL